MMQNIINLKKYRSILCLNGDLPDALFFTHINLPIIAADGAANQLNKMGIAPQLIAGDLDSVYPPLLQQHSFLHLPEQSSSDYQKTMAYLQNHHLLPAIVVGINGGHLDHILNNINIFMETDCLLYSPPITGLVINKKSRFSCSLPAQTKISLIGIPQAILSSTGLKWELNHTNLSFPGHTSCFNRTLLPEIVLEAHQGAALVLIYDKVIEDAGYSSNCI